MHTGGKNKLWGEKPKIRKEKKNQYYLKLHANFVFIEKEDFSVTYTQSQ